MKRFLVTLMMSVCMLSLTAQDYNTGIGIRLGGQSSGVTVKHFVNPTSAIEGIVGFGYKHFLLTGLYEKHLSIANAPGLAWFYGGGAHIGFFSYGGYYRSYKNHYYVEYPGDNAAVIGIDFIIGLDYKIRKAPLSIGLDLKPFIDFYNGTSGYFDGAFSFRFVF